MITVDLWSKIPGKMGLSSLMHAPKMPIFESIKDLPPDKRMVDSHETSFSFSPKNNPSSCGAFLICLRPVPGEPSMSAHLRKRALRAVRPGRGVGAALRGDGTALQTTYYGSSPLENPSLKSRAVIRKGRRFIGVPRPYSG